MLGQNTRPDPRNNQLGRRKVQQAMLVVNRLVDKPLHQFDKATIESEFDRIPHVTSSTSETRRAI